MKAYFTDDRGESIEVDLQRATASQVGAFDVHINGRHLGAEVERHCVHGGFMRIHGRITPFRAARTDSTVEVWIAGRTYRLQVQDRTARRADGGSGGPSSADLMAPMPGTVLKVNVEAGHAFKAHEALIVMESMKMEMTLSAPRDGRVKKVLCAPGDLVEMGELLAQLDESGQSDER